MDDLISRQAAIDTIQKYKVERGYAYFDCASEIENDIKNLPSAQPDVPDRNVGDMISRQVALKEIEEWISALYENAHYESASDGKMILNAIKHLPSAQPEHKKGKWIPVTYRYVIQDGEFPKTTIKWQDATEPDDVEGMKCSECGTIYDFTEARNWCSECGSDMRGENDETD